MSYHALSEIERNEKQREIERLRHYYGTNYGLPEAVLNELREMVECENHDNFRFARAGESGMMDQYCAQYRKGCCAYIDRLVYDEVTGDFWLVGWNYGH